ncbi:uncharacterized protein LOC135826103 [Sycon ciliatum]|uniref:uncharacterized protein LOC135826103 n=1 Tax=Sycon ciliatum TaxID=27933 RepID=UPI0031F700FA
MLLPHAIAVLFLTASLQPCDSSEASGTRALTLAYQEAPTAGQNVPMGLAVPSATVPAAIVWSSGIEGSGHQDIGNIASSPSNIDPASTTITVQLGTTGRRGDHKGNVPGGKKKGMSGRLIAVAVILPIMFIGLLALSVLYLHGARLVKRPLNTSHSNTSNTARNRAATLHFENGDSKSDAARAWGDGEGRTSQWVDIELQ